MALGIVLGVVFAVMAMSPNPVLQGVAALYIWFFRGTPLILQLMLWFNLAVVFPRLGIHDLFSVRTVEVITPFVRSEERRVGKGGVSTVRSGWSAEHKKKQ